MRFKPLIQSATLAVMLALGAPCVHADRAAEPGPRAALVERAIATAEAAVANPAFVKGESWANFTAILRDPATQALDDDDFRRAFNDAAEALPFTHFRLKWQSPPTPAGEAEAMISLEWPREDVALVRIRMFEGDPAEFSEILATVIERQPRALIIDLRGNPGGSFPTAVALSRALHRDALDAGAFLARGWFDRHGDYPSADQYEAIEALDELDLAAYARKLRNDGAARLILPAHDEPIFEGQTLILVDGDTASTCEPLARRLQESGIPILGERTAGAMLSAEHFPLDDTLRLFVPVADYVTPSLERLDRRGVEPDIEVAAEAALDRALALIDES
ncbi:S41 family peptidase [Wenzhouxiangella marina]|uniref:Uncharacterized protein n=1 Tax=Wenzhouxiangella marina TaxID=1579979 RepID=A0A0K0XRY9_9GAMM|nr:S41 family peptidase [Wenzhouxiangella marina]AKS40458.1 hypothetical protein WM2015_67 [Wenzhouxiangella marina]MBB6088220.1 carboxyl-terminal processing protease [Wenzhouxiangella marina]